MQRKCLSARLLLLLLLGLLRCAELLRLDEDIDLEDLEGDVVHQPSDEDWEMFEESVEAGAKIAGELTCDDIGTRMVDQVRGAESALGQLLDTAIRWASEEDRKEVEERVAVAAETINVLAGEADKRKCLVAVMEKAEVKAEIQTLLDNHLVGPLGLLREQEPPSSSMWGGSVQGVTRHPFEFNLTFDPLGSVGGEGFDEVSRLRYSIEGLRSGHQINFTTSYFHDNNTVRNEVDFSGMWDSQLSELRGTVSINGALGDHFRLYPATRDATVSFRLGDAYRTLLAWQRGSLDMAGPELERTVRFEQDVEDPANCPAPCGKCTKEHNSWRKSDELFKFKCLLKRGQAAPAEEGLECSPPVRRRSFWRPHVWPRKTWCTVRDWKATACRQLRVTSMMDCGIRRIFNALESWYDGRAAQDWPDNYTPAQQYSDCVEGEMAMQEATEWLPKWLPLDLMAIHLSIPRKMQLTFGVVLSVGLANGLAALRDASKPEPQNVSAALLAPFLRQGREVDPELRMLFNGSTIVKDNCEEVAQNIIECHRSTWGIRMGSSMPKAGRFLLRLLTGAVGLAVGGFVAYWTWVAVGYALFPGGLMGYSKLDIFLSGVVGAMVGLSIWNFDERCGWDLAQGDQSWTELLEEKRLRISQAQ